MFQAKRISTGEFAAIKVIKLEQGDDFGIIQQEILMMKVRMSKHLKISEGLINRCLCLFTGLPAPEHRCLLRLLPAPGQALDLHGVLRRQQPPGHLPQ